MEIPAKSGLHPMLWVAAVAVTAFSLVGIGALTGLIGKSEPKPEELTVTAPPQEAVQAPQATPAPPEVEAKQAAPAPEPPAKKAVAPAKSTPAKSHASAKPAVAAAVPSQPAERSEPAPAPVAQCAACGEVSAIRAVEAKGEGTGLGAIAGGVVGGALGNKVGKGSGNALATIAGAVAGGYAGHQVERSVRKTTQYEIIVQMDNGGQRTLIRKEQPVWREGDRVEVGPNGELSAAPGR